MTRDSDARGGSAAGAKDNSEQDRVSPLPGAQGPIRDTQSAALLATIAQRLESTELRVFTLASAFLAELDADAWAPAFEAWADTRNLTPELRQAVRRTILRRRCFGAVRYPEARPHGRRRARRG